MLFEEHKAPLQGLEWCAEYDIFTDIAILQDAIETIVKTEHLFQGYIRFLLIVKEESEVQYWANAVPNLPNFLKEKIRFDIFCIKGFYKNLPPLPKGWTYGGDIRTYQDCVNLVESGQGIDFLSFKISDKNIKEIIDGFYYLRRNKLETTFMTFKIDEDATFTDSLKQILEPFFKDEIEQYYFYNIIKQQVYNNAEYCSLKNIRPFQKYQHKFISEKLSNIVQNYLGDIRAIHGDALMPPKYFSSKELVEKLTLLSQHPIYHEIGVNRYLDERCSTCQYKSFCQTGSEETIKIKPSDCENTKLAIFIQDLLETTPPSFEKFQFFQKEENQISA